MMVGTFLPISLYSYCSLDVCSVLSLSGVAQKGLGSIIKLDNQNLMCNTARHENLMCNTAQHVKFQHKNANENENADMNV